MLNIKEKENTMTKNKIMVINSAFIPNFMALKHKLEVVFGSNKHLKEFQFFGVEMVNSPKDEKGILVKGKDPQGIEWNKSKFYPIPTIHELYNHYQLTKKMGYVL